VSQWTDSVNEGLNAPIEGTADFNNDGKTDTLFRTTTTGNAVIARMEGHLVAEWVTIGVLPLAAQIQSP
jgi:hypothetical protein